MTGGRGVDVAFEVAGEQDAVDDAFEAVVTGGKVILAGIPREDCTSFHRFHRAAEGLDHQARPPDETHLPASD